MKVYSDTNFLTRFYLDLPDSAAAFALLEEFDPRRGNPIPITWLHQIELVNAFQFHVFLAGSSGHARVTIEQAAAAYAQFRELLTRRIFLSYSPISVSDLEHECEELSLRHTAKHGFRTYDLVHVASALCLGCDTFWSFDPKASKLAALEGFKTNLPTRA